MSPLAQIMLAIVGSTAISSLVQFFVNRHDNKKHISDKLNKLERDVLRSQLLMLILLKPEEQQEILTIGEHYFKVLKGDWYMTTIFNKWLATSNVAKPEWFKEEK